MLGHKLCQRLPEPIEAYVTVRSEPAGLQRFGFYCPDRTVLGVDARDLATVERAIELVRPQAVVNCIGIVKQHASAQDPVAAIEVNSLFPHRLNALCGKHGARLIHVSTDCVFSGLRGGYREGDPADARDLYGRSKALGEVCDGTAVTLRTSIIGRELTGTQGLVEWFLSNRHGRVKGYSRARFSGVTTDELSNVVANVILEHEGLRGLWQVASQPIDKSALLGLLNLSFRAEAEIVMDETVAVDRTLDGTAFAEETGYVSPGWPQMVAAMASDPTPYDKWKTS